MFFFQGAPAQPFAHPTSFPGIYSEDDFVNDMAQSRAAHGYGFGNHHRYHHHPHHHRHHPGGFYRGPFAPASWDNLWYGPYGFGPACAASHPAFFSQNRHGPAHSPDDFAYNIWQQNGHQRAHDRLEAIERQRELARRERETQRQRALAEAAAREQQARAAREEHIRAACAARTQARQARAEEVLLALLGQLGLALDLAQSSPVSPEVNRQQPFVQSTHSPVTAAPTAAPSQSPVPADHKGKGKAVDVPVEGTMPTPASVPTESQTPNFKEELEARIRSETDPDVQESLVLLYSDIYDVREPAQPVAGPSGHKHVSFQVPISGPSSSSASGSPVPVSVQAEEPIDTMTSPSSPTIALNPAEEDDDGSEERLYHTSPLPSLAQIKDVEDTLRKLEGAFEFPAQLDFVDHSRSPSPPHPRSEAGSDTEMETASLAYTANNTPVRAYEHALSELLAKLDAVESNGDMEVRGWRKEVVKEVERTLEAMDRRIEENRERSRERARRGRQGSVSSQVSDASATVTPYNAHNSDNVVEVEVEVAVAAEETPAKIEEDAVEASVEVEHAKTSSDVEDAPITAEDTAYKVEVNEHVPTPTKANPETNAHLSHVDIAEPKLLQRAVGIPDSGAEPNPPSPPSNQSIHRDPSLPVDDDEALGGAFEVLSPPDDAAASHAIPPAIDTPVAPFHEFDDEVAEQENVDAVPMSEPQAAPEPAENPTSPSTLPAVAPPAAVTRTESSATDANFVSAEADSEPVPLSAADDATFDTATPSEPELTQPSAPVPTPDSPASTSSAGEETFLLSSTPLADEHQPKRRRPSTSASADWEDDRDFDELEIIGRDELEAARDDSDWSDVESASESELEVV